MHIRAILFDIDGTLVDSNGMHVLAWEEAFSSLGKSFQRRVIHDQIGKGADMLVPALMPNLDGETQKKLGELQGQIFKKKFRDLVKPFPYAYELMAHAHGLGQQVALASSASEEDLHHYLDLLNARHISWPLRRAVETWRTRSLLPIFLQLPCVSYGGQLLPKRLSWEIRLTTSRRQRKLVFPRLR